MFHSLQHQAHTPLQLRCQVHHVHLHVQSYPLADWRQDPRVLGMSPFLCWPCGQGQALAFHTTVDEVAQRRRGDRPRNTLYTPEMS